MKILNSLQLKNGATTEPNQFRSINQPVQFLSKDRKDLDWAKQNADWWELQGIRQIKMNGKRLLKNIKLAKGIIDTSDYIPSEENELSDMIEILQDKGVDPYMELKFFPIIPNVINILKAEFAKRTSKLMFIAKDDDSYNEMLEEKRSMIEQSLLSSETEKMKQKLIEAGMNPNSEQFQQQMAPDNIRSLPQIQQFFNKDYQSLIALWATHQQKADERKFHMQEMEVNAFESSLTCDREFWHFPMYEDDFGMELWDPIFTATFKSKNTDYVSNGNAIVNIKFESPADIIDNYGYLMNEDQLKSLEYITGNRAYDNYTMEGVANDGSMYDSSKSHEWNTQGPSLAMRQFTSFRDDFLMDAQGIDDLFHTDGDNFEMRNSLRVTTYYHKTQRRLFHLTKITDDGRLIQKVVDEDYKVTDIPVYNMKLFKERNAESLIRGENLDPIWINEVWGGVKIGKGRGAYRTTSTFDFEPIYLGIDNKTPSRLKFQLKGDDSLYGCKLPVEGRIFSGKNTKSTCIVDLMKPGQINYNMVNNQISDILMDEIGPVAMIDQNGLPKHSLGEDWGPGNYQKAREAMQKYKMLPLDTSTRNMEGQTNFNQYGMLNFDETNRLAGRINLSKHFKEQTMEVIGITPQRVGQIQASETATGTENAVNNSYSQTEMLFVQHSDWLMPRVHSMRTDIAQYYHSRKPSLRLQYVTSMDEHVNFEMNTTGILSRTIGVFATTDVKSRNVLETMQKLFISDNTNKANMHDLGQVLKADSLAEMDLYTKQAEAKVEAQRQAQMDHEDKLNQDQINAAAQEKADQRAYDAEQKRLDRLKDIQVAEIRGAGMPSTDVQKDGEDDYIQKLNYIQKDDHFNAKLDLDREKEINKTNRDLQDDQIKREEIAAKKHISDQNLRIAQTNQTKSELIAAGKLKGKVKK